MIENGQEINSLSPCLINLYVSNDYSVPGGIPVPEELEP